MFKTSLTDKFILKGYRAKKYIFIIDTLTTWIVTYNEGNPWSGSSSSKALNVLLSKCKTLSFSLCGIAENCKKK